MSKWKLALLATLVVVAAVGIWKFAQQRVPPAPPYSGPTIYVTRQAAQQVVVLQAGPSVDREIDVGTPVQTMAVAPSGGKLYLALSDAIRIIDTQTGSTVGSLPIGGAVAILLHPDGQTMFVGIRGGGNPLVQLFGDTVKVVNLATQTVTQTIPLTGLPGSIALSQDGKFLYVGESTSEISAIDWKTNTKVHTAAVGVGVRQIVSNPSGQGVDVLSDDGYVTPIDTQTYSSGTKIPVGKLSYGMAFNTVGNRLLVSRSVSNSISAYDPFSGMRLGGSAVGLNPTVVQVSRIDSRGYILNTVSNSISVVDPDNGGLLDTVPLVANIKQLVLDPVLPRGYAIGTENKLLVLDMNWFASGRELATIPTQQVPGAFAVHAPSHRVYVSNVHSKSITVIDSSTRKPVETIPISRYPGEIVVDPTGTDLYGAAVGPVSVVWDLDLNTKAFSEIAVDGGAGGMAINKKGDLLFAAIHDLNKVAVISLLTHAEIGSIDVGQGPRGLFLMESLGVERLYVANQDDDSVTIYPARLPTQREGTVQLKKGAAPYLMVGSLRNARIYVLRANGAVSMFEIQINSPDGPDFLIAGSPLAIALSTDDNRVYATNSSGPVWQINRDGGLSEPLAWNTKETQAITVVPE